MKQKFFSRWFAIGMIATALVMSCSKDNKDEPTLNNVVMIDGQTRSILSAEITKDDLDKKNYYIGIFWAEGEYIEIFADYENHDGKVIDLTKKEPEREGWYWGVRYHKSKEIIFNADADPTESYPVFQSGTLYLKRLADADEQPVFEIELKNGKVKGEGKYGDGKEHTINFHYKGKLELVEL
ncbi:hypothetical protein [Capnocytophaga canimorsus]|uniref:hypothetical protein n=1 Tax=Capnocytophaga canimorsus TaxID=28188 RepID=UPI0037D95B50